MGVLDTLSLVKKSCWTITTRNLSDNNPKMFTYREASIRAHVQHTYYVLDYLFDNGIFPEVIFFN